MTMLLWDRTRTGCLSRHRSSAYGTVPIARTGWRFSVRISLSEEEIIRLYGKRWDIEVFFKTCKSYLKLLTECHSLSYDALTAHTSIVLVRYMLLALEQRKSTDSRSFGELFMLVVDELADNTFSYSMQLIVAAILDSIHEVLHSTDEQIERLMSRRLSSLCSGQGAAPLAPLRG